jgi:hypothetical protein
VIDYLKKSAIKFDEEKLDRATIAVLIAHFLNPFDLPINFDGSIQRNN